MTLEPSLLRATTQALLRIGRSAYSRKRLESAVAKAREVFSFEEDRFVDGLDPAQLDRLARFLKSDQFRFVVHLTLHAELANKKPDHEVWLSLRGVLKESLRLAGVLEGADLTQSSEILLANIRRAILAVHKTSTPGLNDEYAIANAADIAGVAARSSELLARVSSVGEFNEFGRKLRRQAAALYSQLRIPNVAQSRLVPYSDLYVPPTLSAERRWGQVPGASTDDVFARNPRVVVLGDPGAGKSTLAAKLVFDLSNDRIVGLTGAVPILLAVRKHTEGLRQGRNTLVKYLEEVCRNPHNLEPPELALEYLLLNGSVTVIIDGVDELGDSTFREDFARMVEQFAHLYPLARIIVTSRIVGYSEAPLDSGMFCAAKVEPFNEDQVRAYARLWFDLDQTLPVHERNELFESFLRDSGEAADIRCNPLILSLLCVLYTTEHAIPDRRPEIYERCAEVLFDAWDRSRGIKGVYGYRQHIRPMVQVLAWQISNDPRRRQAVPRSEVRDVLASYLRPKFKSVEEATEAAGGFLDFCAGRAWVLTDMGSDLLEPLYGFTHRTFLEYFTASQLVA